MRRARLRIPSDQGAAIYHCLSRIVDRRFIFEVPQKEHFVSLMRECEAFCEVRVLTYALLSNHFHILVEVPRRPERLPTAEEILAKLQRLSGHQNVEAVRQRFELYRRQKDPEAERRYLESFHARLWDLSAFMKLLKQRFTQWFNLRTGRQGTLWEDRFKSVLVEGAGHALVTMAAYIELNAVRAGLVKDPKGYRWCGYAEAVAGRKGARLGVQSIVGALLGGRQESLSRSLEVYRTHLFGQGSEEKEGVREDGQPVRGALPREEVLRVLEAKGKLTVGDYLRCRVRYFSDGAVFGSREFVEGIFRRYRKRFGPKRRTGARPLRGLAQGEGEGQLCSLRDLRLRVFG
jgi:putative transposase